MVLTPRTKRRLQRIASSFNAKARRYHVAGVISWQMLTTRGDECFYCGVGLDLDHGTWDHVTAFDRGGDNWISNVVRCCTTCQRTKHTKTPQEFQAHRSLMVTCARPDCGTTFKPRWGEHAAGRARFCSHKCAGMARGKGW